MGKSVESLLFSRQDTSTPSIPEAEFQSPLASKTWRSGFKITLARGPLENATQAFVPYHDPHDVIYKFIWGTESLVSQSLLLCSVPFQRS